MAYYIDSDQFYVCAKMLFAQTEEQDPGAADAILASHLVIRLGCTEPEAEIIINGRKRPVQITLGPSSLRPTLDIQLKTDTLHRIMLGELPLKSALAQGLLDVRGPVWKVTALADLFHRLQALYPGVLQECGLDAESLSQTA